eukprot:superscaffoldBa00002440_g14247
MSKPKPPVPQPRRQFSHPDNTVDDKPPNKWNVRTSSEGSDTGNVRLGTVKMLAKQFANDACKAHPPLMSAKPRKEKSDDENENEILDVNSLKGWWKVATPWSCLCTDHSLRGERETKIIKVKAQQLCNAIKYYMNLLSENSGTLKKHIDDLLCIADNLDKFSKGTKIAGITGGATSVAGGVAAAAGVILSPFTLGASLALTAVGVGVVAAGGVTGASAAIAHKDGQTLKKGLESKFAKKIRKLAEELNNGLEEHMEIKNSFSEHFPEQ